MRSVALVCLDPSNQIPGWALGKQIACAPTPGGLSSCLDSHLQATDADACLFWDPTLGLPDQDLILALLAQPADVWHAGLKLGLARKPGLIDYVAPTWMLNRDPAPTIEATSWRLSLRACLVRTSVLHQLGGPDPGFETLAGAGLELGYRYIRRGAFVRHVPALIKGPVSLPKPDIPMDDQLRFIHLGFGKKWLTWAIIRALLNHKEKPRFKTCLHFLQAVKPHELQPYKHNFQLDKTPINNARVTVLIPTVDRYPYLRTLLAQLGAQSHPPFEIIIVDQTPLKDRDLKLVEDYPNLPIRLFNLDRAGQCSSRNLGLQQAQGDFIYFIDDDDEIPPAAIAAHLQALASLQVNISNGVAHEVGAGDLPAHFRFMRISDVFPTNNTLVRKNSLHKSGLFDLAYDHGQRADHDLGMRLYLSGEMMVLVPWIDVLHHHAPVGGLREHKARVDTYAASRSRIFKSNLPTISDIYLAKRYFTPSQAREMLWISVLGTFSIKGSGLKKLLKMLVSLLSLPKNLWQVNLRRKMAEKLLLKYPEIPQFDPGANA
mgnify:CR=1 FL=1